MSLNRWKAILFTNKGQKNFFHHTIEGAKRLAFDWYVQNPWNQEMDFDEFKTFVRIGKI